VHLSSYCIEMWEHFVKANVVISSRCPGFHSASTTIFDVVSVHEHCSVYHGWLEATENDIVCLTEE
jgi:hypothetical protein